MGFINQSVAQIRSLWGRLSRMQQVALVAIGGCAILFAFVFLRMGGTPTYAVAFTNLDPKDASAAADELKANSIPYLVTPDGTTIKVPAANVADARLKLAAKGLPQSGAVGFELFDKQSFGVTDFVQNVNYQRALEGELTRTINTLTEVQGSRVHIVVPKDALFASQQKPATASVLLQFRPGHHLTEDQLQGVSHLISRSIEGLDEKNITILDSSGHLLYDGNKGSNSALGLSATQLGYQRQVEADIEAKVQGQLDRVAGPNRSAVKVSADMDFSQQESTSVQNTAGGQNGQGVPVSSQTSSENYNGPGAAGGLPAGTAPNLPGTPAAAAASPGPGSQYQTSNNTTNYAVNQTTTKSVEAPARLKRISVSVLLDSSVTDKDAANLQSSIAAAAGIDTKRGDQLVVTTAAFNAASTSDGIVIAKPGLIDLVMQYAKVGAPLLAALIVLLVIWRMSRSVAPKKRPLSIYNGQAALPAGAAQAYAWAGGAIGAGGSVGAIGPGSGDMLEGDRTQALLAPIEPVISEEKRRRQEIQTRMTNLATANPDTVADIIHTWIAQDERKR